MALALCGVDKMKKNPHDLDEIIGTVLSYRPKVEHLEFTLIGELECGYCKKRFPVFYKNKREEKNANHSYYGNGQKYNFRAARANFYRHIKSCESKRELSI